MSGGDVHRAVAEGWTVGECREYLRRAAADIREALAVQKQAEAYAWGHLPLHQRSLLLMLAGVDGDLDALAERPWQVVPMPEREAIRDAMRGQLLAWRSLMGCWGLPRGVW